MKINSLEITRRSSYDDEYPNMLVGTVTMTGDNGNMTVKLSNPTVAAIFKLIAEDVTRVARDNARQALHAVSEAEAEGLLLSSQRVALEHEIT